MTIKPIPETKGFMVSPNGKVFDSKGNEKKQYTNGDGYKTASVLTSKGKWQTFGVHRLVALAHLELPDQPDDYVVNHRDHDLKNNDVCNLEWSTDALNNIHAALFKGTTEFPSILVQSPEGKYEFISNIQKVSKRFQLDVGLVWDLIRNGTEYKGWLFRHNGVRDKIPVSLHKENMYGDRIDGRLAPRKVDIKNIETQVVVEYASLYQAAKGFNTTPRHILKLMSGETRTRLFKKKYLIVDHGKQFPVITQKEYEEAISSLGKNVIAYNFAEDKHYIFESAAAFIRANKLSKKTVTVNLKKDRIRKVHDWIFLYRSLENIKRMTVASRSPVPEIT